MKPEHITVFGSGVLGAQIAFQTAFHGYTVVLYDIADELLAKAKEKFDQYGKIYQQDMHASAADIEATLSRITYTTDLARSVADADLTIEAIPESIQIKKDFYTKLVSWHPKKPFSALTPLRCYPASLPLKPDDRRSFWPCTSLTRYGNTTRPRLWATQKLIRR